MSVLHQVLLVVIGDALAAAGYWVLDACELLGEGLEELGALLCGWDGEED